MFNKKNRRKNQTKLQTPGLESLEPRVLMTTLSLTGREALNNDIQTDLTKVSTADEPVVTTSSDEVITGIPAKHSVTIGEKQSVLVDIISEAKAKEGYYVQQIVFQKGGQNVALVRTRSDTLPGTDKEVTRKVNVIGNLFTFGPGTTATGKYVITVKKFGVDGGSHIVNLTVTLNKKTTNNVVNQRLDAAGTLDLLFADPAQRDLLTSSSSASTADGQSSQTTIAFSDADVDPQQTPATLDQEDDNKPPSTTQDDSTKEPVSRELDKQVEPRLPTSRPYSGMGTVVPPALTLDDPIETLPTEYYDPEELGDRDYIL